MLKINIKGVGMRSGKNVENMNPEQIRSEINQVISRMKVDVKSLMASTKVDIEKNPSKEAKNDEIIDEIDGILNGNRTVYDDAMLISLKNIAEYFLGLTEEKLLKMKPSRLVEEYIKLVSFQEAFESFKAIAFDMRIMNAASAQLEEKINALSPEDAKNPQIIGNIRKDIFEKKELEEVVTRLETKVNNMQEILATNLDIGDKLRKGFIVFIAAVSGTMLGILDLDFKLGVKLAKEVNKVMTTNMLAEKQLAFGSLFKMGGGAKKAVESFAEERKVPKNK